MNRSDIHVSNFFLNVAPFFKLPYRVVFAVATLNSLYVYDTESVVPIAILAGVHYAAITDIAWFFSCPFAFTLVTISVFNNYLLNDE